MRILKEIAKFVCGAEAFHALAHAYFAAAGTTLVIFGFTLTPTWHTISAAVNSAIAVLLGLYGWTAFRKGRGLKQERA